VAVVGAIHGDERAGALIIEELRESFVPDGEECVALVIGNPRALEKGTRNTPTGSDLNRVFGKKDTGVGYEESRGALLRQMLGSVKRLLDIHQTHCDTPPLAVTRLDGAHLKLVAQLNLKTAVVGVDKIYRDSMLSDWVDERGGIGITIESGRADTEEAFQVGYEAALRMLRKDWAAVGVVRVFDVDHLIRAPFTNGRWSRPVGNGTEVEKGEVLVQSGERQLKSPGKGVLLLPHEGVEEGGVQAVFALDRGWVNPDELAAGEGGDS